MLRNKAQIPQSGKVIHIRVHAYLSSCRKRQSPNEPWYPCPHGVQSPSPHLLTQPPNLDCPVILSEQHNVAWHFASSESEL